MMESPISERLIQVLEDRRMKAKLEGDLERVQGDIITHARGLEDLSTQLAAEEVDVEKLEGTSLSALFYGLLGEREERLQKERQEMLQARLAYQNVKRRLAALERDREYLLRQLERLGGVEHEYQSVLAEKETYLAQAKPQVAKELIELSQNLAHLNHKIKELEEAIEAGERVILSLNRVHETLDRARTWGVFDMVGGGLISTMAKHSKIDEARDHAQQAEVEMSRFNRELADINERQEMTVEITGFEAFADYFLDGLIFDWIVQSKIKTALGRTQQVRTKTEVILDRIRQAHDADLQAREDLQARRTELIHAS